MLSVAITSGQQGLIAESEFVKIAILTSGGAIVPSRPVIDEERRDWELHVRHHFAQTIAVQMKTARRLRLHGRSRRLQIGFAMKLPIVVDPHLWFLLARFDIAAMGLDDPLFLVPSRFFVRHAGHGFRGGVARFQFHANMEVTADDIWTPHRVLKADLGHRLMEILEELPPAKRGEASSNLLATRNLIWVPGKGAGFQASRLRAA